MEQQTFSDRMWVCLSCWAVRGGLLWLAWEACDAFKTASNPAATEMGSCRSGLHCAQNSYPAKAGIICHQHPSLLFLKTRL